ncbi:MAG: anthranilate synthase component I family protein [Vampirovibrionales bacterium]|nr:anthranilate synthase component I family protein [Vampirovibrionales bacterium]
MALPSTHQASMLRIRSWASDTETPVSLFARLSANASTAFLLDSTEGDSRLARFSIIGVNPSQIFKVKHGVASLISYADHREQHYSWACLDPLAWLAEQMAMQTPHVEARKKALAAAMPLPWEGSLPFTGGWAGVTGYGATQYSDHIDMQANDPLGLPDLCYGRYDEVIVIDHRLRRTFWLCDLPQDEADKRWDCLQRVLNAPHPAPLTPLPLDYFQDKLSRPDWIFQNVEGPFDKMSFCQAIQQAKAWIGEGQIFQLVVAQRFSLPVSQNVDSAFYLTLYRVLQAINPTPYGYFLKFPDASYVGSSPETFVTCTDNRVKLRALAGTRYRGKSQAEDDALASELVQHPKELAEHRMLVDLDRNDLGRVCETGSIYTGAIAQLTRYTHVMHLTTDIEGHLRKDKTPLDLFKACLPRGTVSGAPKIRAMQLLSQLEPEQRGWYSGVVGYFGKEGNMDGAIAIRSAVLQPGWVHVHAGAGVVFDAVPEHEYLETRNKAKSTLAAAQIALALSTALA